MGNTPTTLNNKDNDEFLEYLDKLVANFLVQPEFQYYKNLSDIEECNKIFFLSKELFKKYLDHEKTTTLHKRVNVGNIVFGKDLQIVRDKEKIKKFIEDIAKFYTTIANIITTISLSMGLNIQEIYLKHISPQFNSITKEENRRIGELRTIDNLQKKLFESKQHETPHLKNLNTRFSLTPFHNMSQPHFYGSPTPYTQLYSPNIVDHSIMTGQQGGNTSRIDFKISPSTHSIKILSSKLDEVDFCEKQNDLMNYEAIKELLQLFNNEDLDPKTLEFRSADIENDTLKQHAIAKLKETFDKVQNNPDLQSFCKSGMVFPKSFETGLKSNDKFIKMFEEYGKNLGKITLLEKNAQNKLLELLKLIIIFPTFGGKSYKINPELNHNLLSKIVEKTRNILVNYFMEVELLYGECVDIYLILYKELKLLERESLSSVQEKLLTIKEGGYICKHKNKRNKGKTKKLKLI